MPRIITNQVLPSLQRMVSGKSEKFVFRWIFLLNVGISSFLFLKRLSGPDNSYDTVNYHFFAGADFGVKNLGLGGSGEFLPSAFWTSNPLIDGLNYNLAQLVGYRLGTLLGFLSYLVMIYFALKLVQQFAIETQKWVKIITYTLIASALIVNEALFQLATYYVDVFYAAIGLIFIYQAVNFSSKNRNFRHYLLLGLWLAVLSTKVTNIIIVIPVIFVIAKLKGSDFWNSGIALTALIPSALISLPFYFNVFLATNNPFFPQLNGVFQSKFYPPENWQFNLGPQTFQERIFYPVFALLNPTITGEVKDIFPDLKYVLLQVALVIVIVIVKVARIDLDKRLLVACYGVMLGNLTWQFLFGYVRYAIALELLTGLLVVLVMQSILNYVKFKVSALIATLATLVCIGYAAGIVLFNSKYDISWRSGSDISSLQSLVASGELFARETKVEDEFGEKLKKTSLVIICANASAGYAKTIPALAGKPFLNFSGGPNSPILSLETYSKTRNETFLRSTPAHGELFNFSSVITTNQIDECTTNIANYGNGDAEVKIEHRNDIGNFVGDRSISLVVIRGTVAFAK